VGHGNPSKGRYHRSARGHAFAVSRPGTPVGAGFGSTETAYDLRTMTSETRAPWGTAAIRGRARGWKVGSAVVADGVVLTKWRQEAQ